jgi:hypothetical protein
VSSRSLRLARTVPPSRPPALQDLRREILIGRWTAVSS